MASIAVTMNDCWIFFPPGSGEGYVLDPDEINEWGDEHNKNFEPIKVDNIPAGLGVTSISQGKLINLLLVGFKMTILYIGLLFCFLMQRI